MYPYPNCVYISYSHVYCLHFQDRVLNKSISTTTCEETKLDNILKKVAAAITNEGISIMGNESSKFNQIFSELTVRGNKLDLKAEQIVLPETLHK